MSRPPQPGDLIADRYELEELVGTGGMSTVFRAHDRQLERRVAIKILHEHYADDPEYLERFRREARAVAKLSHPNIVTVIDRGDDGGRQYIVFEHVEGENLKELVVRSGRLPVRRALELALDVAGGLAFAHDHGLVHRDVKPQNVLLSREGEAKVTDFGIARSLHVEHGVTQTGTVLGTGEYLAPEQASGKQVVARDRRLLARRRALGAAGGRRPVRRRELRRRRAAPRQRAAAEPARAEAGRHAETGGSGRPGAGQGSGTPLPLHGGVRQGAARLPRRGRRGCASAAGGGRPRADARHASRAGSRSRARTAAIQASGALPPAPPFAYVLLALVAAGAAFAAVVLLGGAGHHGGGLGGGGSSGTPVPLQRSRRRLLQPGPPRLAR